ncbi:hypothetical protein OSB04_024733 [Centaurea solstitialis]|uniref:Uncharacterized protein n=1 Tax=Centaurea solstitialis TaxID=347529 RepID=A0AA38T036_9ASTR|nr:hypothetical protein OSB04_024733 [Centaurea solstitialis]
MSKEIISIGSETRPRVLVVGEYQQWKRRMINFLDLLNDKLMVSITEGPIRPTVTVAEVARNEITPYLPAYEVEKPYDMFSHEQRARAAIDKRALTLLTLAIIAKIYITNIICIYIACFGFKGKSGPRYIGPIEILERVGAVAYRYFVGGTDVVTLPWWLQSPWRPRGRDKALEGQKENAMNAYERFCAREGETLTDTYNRLNICVNDLRRLGLEKNKYEVNVKFLKRLNKLWQSVTISIQVSQNLGQLGLHDLYSMMLPHEETLFGKTKKKIDPPTLALMANRGSSSHDNYTVEEPVVLDEGLTEEKMFQLENSFALMAKFRGNPQLFNRVRQGGQSSQGGYQSRENFQRNDQGRSNNYQQRDSSGYNPSRILSRSWTRGYQGGGYNQRWNNQSGPNSNNQNQKSNDEGRQYNNTGGTEPPQQNKLPSLEAPPAANQNRNLARVPTYYNCGTPGHYTSERKIKLKDSAYFEKKAAMMKKKELGKVLMLTRKTRSWSQRTQMMKALLPCKVTASWQTLRNPAYLVPQTTQQREKLRMELESGIRESILENKLLDLQRSHDEIENGKAVSFTTSPANSSTSSPPSSPVANGPIFTPASNPENTFSSWEGIKARTPKVATPPINYANLNFSYDSREIDTSMDADVI